MAWSYWIEQSADAFESSASYTEENHWLEYESHSGWLYDMKNQQTDPSQWSTNWPSSFEMTSSAASTEETRRRSRIAEVGTLFCRCCSADWTSRRRFSCISSIEFHIRSLGDIRLLSHAMTCCSLVDMNHLGCELLTIFWLCLACCFFMSRSSTMTLCFIGSTSCRVFVNTKSNSAEISTNCPVKLGCREQLFLR